MGGWLAEKGHRGPSEMLGMFRILIRIVVLQVYTCEYLRFTEFILYMFSPNKKLKRNHRMLRRKGRTVKWSGH